MLGEYSNGPYSPLDGDKAHIQNYSNLDMDIWDTFLVSGIYEGSAFDSYFSLNMKDIDISFAKEQEVTLIAKRNQYYIVCSRFLDFIIYFDFF